MRTVVPKSVDGWVASASMLPASRSRLGLFSTVLIMMAIISSSVAAQSQRPQEWNATQYEQTFPSESAALAAIHALGGRFKFAEVIQSVPVSPTADRFTYTYKARSRPQDVSAWAYSQ